MACYTVSQIKIYEALIHEVQLQGDRHSITGFFIKKRNAPSRQVEVMTSENAWHSGTIESAINS